MDAPFDIRMVVGDRTAAAFVLDLFARNEEDATHPRAVLSDGTVYDLWLTSLEGGERVAALLGTHDNQRPDGTYAGIENLLVDAPYRRQGIGRCLMHAAEAYYRASGLAGVQLAADEQNAIARALYTDLGFTVARTYTRVRNGVTQPRVQMVKRFDDAY